jgi:hypothetical protein
VQNKQGGETGCTARWRPYRRTPARHRNGNGTALPADYYAYGNLEVCTSSVECRSCYRAIS